MITLGAISWYHEYTMGCLVHRGAIMRILGGYYNECGGYHEFPRECSVLWGSHTNSIVFQ